MSVKEKSSGYKKVSSSKPERRKSDPNHLGGDKQPSSGKGVPSYSNTDTQTDHPSDLSIYAISSSLGVSTQKAQDFVDAINEQDVGGFSYGWDTAIREYQNGATRSQILDLDGTSDAIAEHFNGSQDAYFAALRKKAGNCEEFIDRSPKWSGGELMRGFSGLSSATVAALTNTDPNVLINLNKGTASWTTDEGTAYMFSSWGNDGLIAHVVSGERRGTSIRAVSAFDDEDEVLCSRR